LLRVVVKLCAELSPPGQGEIPTVPPELGEGGAMAGILSAEDELWVTRLRGGLARIATALSGGAELTDSIAVRAALDGADLVMRGELINGNEDWLPQLMPSFVFLVALPIVDQDRALAVSRRCAELIELELR
jgi:hypothetical protein